MRFHPSAAFILAWVTCLAACQKPAASNGNLAATDAPTTVSPRSTAREIDDARPPTSDPASFPQESQSPTGEPNPVATAGDSTGSLSVLSWNLEWFFDDDAGDNFSKLAKEQSAPSRAAWNWKRDEVAQSIASANPQIAGLQEIEGRRAIWYLTRAITRNHSETFRELSIDGTDVFTEQDVGFVYRPQTGSLLIHPLAQTFFGRSAAMRADDRYGDVSKHMAVEFEVKLGDAVERLLIVNLHLRAKAEGSAIRTKQARTVHAWLADKVAAGENVLVLGDFNTETNRWPAPAGSDMHAATGKDTPDEGDDLVDLHAFLPVADRQTHLIPGKSFDRILASPSLMVDAPNRVDLCFDKIVLLRELSVRGDVDAIDDHFNNYWNLDPATRDISDHWPIMATFQMR